MYKHVIMKMMEKVQYNSPITDEEITAIAKSLKDQENCTITFGKRGKKELSLKYKYGRKSGDPNTSVGNTIINACTFASIDLFKG